MKRHNAPGDFIPYDRSVGTMHVPPEGDGGEAAWEYRNGMTYVRVGQATYQIAQHGRDGLTVRLVEIQGVGSLGLAVTSSASNTFHVRPDPD